MVQPLWWLLTTPAKVRRRHLDFVVVGAQKSGTTALDSYLRQHPDLCLPEGKKELHFFDDECTMRRPRWYRQLAYHRNFRHCKNSVLLGEVTPSYLLREEYLQRIYQYSTDIKLVVSLRDPVYRAYSQWNMERQRGTESRDFLTAIQEDGKKKISEVPQERAYLQRSLYARQLRILLKYFTRSQLHVIQQDILQSNPRIVLDKLAEFLHVSPFPPLESGRVHGRAYSEPISEYLMQQLRRYFRQDVADLENLLGWDLSEWK